MPIQKLLTLADDIYEDLELWYPKYRLEEIGIQVPIAGLELKEYTGKHGYPAKPDLLLHQAKATDFDGILIPGGFMPDKLRRDSHLLRIVREMDEKKKLIGMICHAGWIPISAKILNGKKVTSTPGIKDDLTNAGANWVDEPVVIDGHIISARRPPDLPAYGKALVEYCQNH